MLGSLLFAYGLQAALSDKPSTPAPAVPKHATPCVDGAAEGFPCLNVDLYAHISNAQLGGGNGNDIWGWTDPDTGREYALMGLTNGTAFVDISDPEFPARLGILPTHSGNSTWRDIKTRGYYAFIVSEATDHGMQVFDLRRLRSVANPPTTFTEDAHYDDFGRAHNIVIDVDSGFAMAVGSRQGTVTCNAGLHLIDINNPLVPSFAGCFSDDGYTHDAQCITYDGPDADYTGREICMASNEDTVTIVDVTNKSATVQISRTPYDGSRYTHQGWLTDDRRYFLVNDELDEIQVGHNTRTYIFDVSDLDQPVLHSTYIAAIAASDHNLYVRGRYAYESNYRSGLRILDLADIDAGNLSEIAFFDTQPSSNAAGTSGAWSVFPYFASGNVIISDVSAGLFLVKPNLCDGPEIPTGLITNAAGANQIQLNWTAAGAGESYEVYRSIDGCGGAEELLAEGISAGNFLDAQVSGGVPYGYRVRRRSADGQCVSDYSNCSAAQTTGACTAPPQFAGIGTAQSAGSSSCQIDLAWAAAAPRCSGPAEYLVQRSSGTSFDELTAVTLQDGLGLTSYSDGSASHGESYAYRVRSRDTANGALDGNEQFLVATPTGPVGNGTFHSGAELGDTLFGVGSVRHIGWEIVSDVAFAGDRSYFSTYGDNACLGLTSPPLNLTPGESAVFSMQSRFDIEAGWDAGVVQISTNGGASWQTLTPVGGYPGTMNQQNSGDACGFPNGQPAFTGTDLSWSPYSFDLSAFSGEIQIRLLLSTDGGVQGQGWWIDEIAISNVQVPGVCDADVLLVNGFE
ncbi:MAG: choice-of-anchor B family protein [Lysobacterales bacterium]